MLWEFGVESMSKRNFQFSDGGVLPLFFALCWLMWAMLWLRVSYARFILPMILSNSLVSSMLFWAALFAFSWSDLKKRHRSLSVFLFG